MISHWNWLSHRIVLSVFAFSPLFIKWFAMLWKRNVTFCLFDFLGGNCEVRSTTCLYMDITEDDRSICYAVSFLSDLHSRIALLGYIAFYTDKLGCPLPIFTYWDPRRNTPAPWKLYMTHKWGLLVIGLLLERAALSLSMASLFKAATHGSSLRCRNLKAAWGTHSQLCPIPFLPTCIPWEL